MNERATGESAALCGCSRPLVDEIKSCVRCGHEIGSTEFALNPRAIRLARLIAEYVVELQSEREQRKRGPKPKAERIDAAQLDFGGEQAA
jgi:hypothetical protein